MDRAKVYQYKMEKKTMIKFMFTVHEIVFGSWKTEKITH
jgi:hypothetical protein